MELNAQSSPAVARRISSMDIGSVDELNGAREKIADKGLPLYILAIVFFPLPQACGRLVQVITSAELTNCTTADMCLHLNVTSIWPALQLHEAVSIVRLTVN